MGRKDTIILNDYSRAKSRSRGRNVNVEVTGTPIIHNFDEAELGKGPAEAIKDAVQREIRGIDQQAAASTIAKRRREGRTSTKLFNDTGKLASGLTVRQGGDGYETVAPRGRLSGDTAGLAGELMEVADISARDLSKDKGVQEAIEESVRVMIKVGRRK